MDRSSGILLPVSALPGPCGIGDLGKAARDFIDFLAAAGQRYWQILPLNPPDGAHSPYLSASTFAGSTDLLSPEPFLARGALTAGEVRAIDWGADPMRVDYDRVHAGRTALWDAAFARERDTAAPALRAALAAEPWLRDYCLYMAVKEEQGGAPWYAWPQPLRDREAAALAAALERLDDRVLLHAYLQTEFTRQWDAVCAYAHAHACASSATCPCTSRPTARTSGRSRRSFASTPTGSRAPPPVSRQTISAPTASSGATRSMIGIPCVRTASSGGKTASEALQSAMMWCALTIFAPFQAIGWCRVEN